MRKRSPQGTPTVGLYGVLVTYRRPESLAEVLRRLEEQERPLDGLVVVDNAPSEETATIVRDHRAQGSVTYVAAPENLGAAGGIDLGMRHFVARLQVNDWIVTIDDGDPPMSDQLLKELLSFAARLARTDPRLGGVGLVGARFDWKRGRTIRVPDEELKGPIAVDYIGGGQFPLYRVGAIRDVGSFSRDIFFGFDDLEFGLRMRRAGYSIYAHGDLWREARVASNRLGLHVRPALGLGEFNWRRYYGLRNLIYILRSNGRSRAALRVTVVSGLGKPLANAFRHPRLGVTHLRLNWKACRDGWRGRMGRTLEPTREAA
jgi:glycosyltransferase involved in cell wall biosynthesis